MAAAALNWAAEKFWASTPHEFWAAWEVWRQMNTPSEE